MVVKIEITNQNFMKRKQFYLKCCYLVALFDADQTQHRKYLVSKKVLYCGKYSVASKKAFDALKFAITQRIRTRLTNDWKRLDLR